MTSRPGYGLPAAVAACELESKATALRAINNLTRAEFSAKVTGMPPVLLIQFMGQSVGPAVKGGPEYWAYNAISSKTSETKREAIDVKIVFENKPVNRVILLGDIKDGK